MEELIAMKLGTPGGLIRGGTALQQRLGETEERPNRKAT